MVFYTPQNKDIYNSFSFAFHSLKLFTCYFVMFLEYCLAIVWGQLCNFVISYNDWYQVKCKENEPSGVVQDVEGWFKEANKSGGPSKSCKYDLNQAGS